MRNILFVVAAILCMSCQHKSVDKHGGLRIHIGFKNPHLDQGVYQTVEEILKQRVNEVSKYAPKFINDGGNIIIELPKAVDSAFYRSLLTSKGEFGIYETYEFKEIFQYLEDINLGLVDSNLLMNTDTSQLDDFEKYAIENPLFAKLRPNFVEDGYGNYSPGANPIAGFVGTEDTALVMKMLKENPHLYPGTLQFKLNYKPVDLKGNYSIIALKLRSKDDKAPITSQAIIDANQGFNRLGTPVINMNMDDEGAQIWERLTGNNVGRALAIVFADRVYSYPTVTSAIPNGRSQISGDFTVEEAKALAAIIKSNALPTSIFIQKIELVEK